MLHPDDATDRKDIPDHIPPGARSPHPYRRQSLDIPDRLFVTNLAARDRQPHGPNARVPRVARNDSEASDYFTRERRPRRATLTTSPSDSGTEADDEKPYLKGLPPARSRPPKGLKGTSGAVTPSDFDGLNDALLAESRGEANTQAAAVLSKEQVDRYVKKWRSELLRRVLEVTFVCGITELILAAELGAYGDMEENGPPEDNFRTLLRVKDIVSAASAMPALHFAWLLFCHIRAMSKPSKDAMRQVQTPPDPARFLYPFMIPICIATAATSSWTHRAEVLRANVVLGAAACWSSRYMLGFLKGDRGLELQWVTAGMTAAAMSGIRPGNVLSAQELDELTFLFPLLAALVPTLQYFCGSSLLAAETKLLSIGLINLLYFASEPQATILHCLMWVGGISLLLACRHIMKWSTMLARIPAWRFYSPRHANAPPHRSEGPSAIATVLQTSSFLPEKRGQDSSDEKEWMIADFPGQAGSAIKHRTTPQAAARRHTFSAPDTRAFNLNMKSHVLGDKKQRKRPFLWMTRTQASIVKWLYAIYCYVAAVTIIFIPVRWYIQEHALSGKEPVGWALGYLLGNLQPFRLHVILTGLDSWICLPPRLGPAMPSTSLFDLHRHYTLGAANTRLTVAAWCVLNLTLGIAAVLQLRSLVEVDTRRKVFHFMMVSMFLPTIFIDPCFVALALTLMLVIFLLLDLFRAAQLPPVSKPLTHFLAPYVDGRDHKGPIVISPIFLLIGCAIPLWLSLASSDRGSDIIADANHPWYAWELPHRDLSMVAGVICVGMGDAAASLIGRRYGKRRWIWSGGKSLEGSAAFVLAVVVGLSVAEIWRQLGGWQSDHDRSTIVGSTAEPDTLMGFLGKITLAGIGASFTEAVLTGGNDNVIVPVVLWLLVRLLKI